MDSDVLIIAPTRSLPKSFPALSVLQPLPMEPLPMNLALIGAEHSFPASTRSRPIYRSCSKRFPERLLICFCVHWQFDAAYLDTDEKKAAYEKFDKQVLLLALQYILHLCSENSIITARKQEKAPSWASRKKKKAQAVNIFDVSAPSERTFSAKHHHQAGNISSEPTGKTVCPHTRRAHWAYRWVGSKENRGLELRWIREAHIHADKETNGAIVRVTGQE